MLQLREELIDGEEDRLAGKPGFTISELDDLMTKTIRETRDARNK